MNRSALWIVAVSLSGAAYAQSSTATLIQDARQAYNTVKNNLMRAAEKMPESDYNFKPVETIQTFGERMAHLANQIGTCSSLTGERKKAVAAKTKSEIVAAVKASFDACDAAWDSMNDKTAMETVAGRGGQQRPKLSVLIGNTNHDSELYGYLAVYMRLKGLVPPSSERM